MNEKKVLSLAAIVSAVVGFGLSLIDWGKTDGVHGTGWPIPTRISGLPEDGSSGIDAMANLGMFGVILNIALVLLSTLLLWALARIFLRLTGRA